MLNESGVVRERADGLVYPIRSNLSQPRREAGATFIERDQARAHALAAHHEVERMKHALTALLVDHRINPSEFFLGNDRRPWVRDVHW